MKSFTIEANECLERDIEAYYHCDYVGYQQPGNPDYINALKHTYDSYSRAVLQQLGNAADQLFGVLTKDLPNIQARQPSVCLTICVIPRAKQESFYSNNQRLFKRVTADVASALSHTGSRFKDGTSYITRHTNTRTTHLNRRGNGGEGPMPYPGIAADTCHISHEVKGKDILLIDDIYTKTVNIDEDMIQALLDAGARSVRFYAVAKTLKRWP